MYPEKEETRDLERHKEGVLFILVGLGSILIGAITFIILNYYLEFNEGVSTIIALIQIVVVFAGGLALLSPDKT